MYAFTDVYSDRYSKIIFLFNGLTGETRKFEHEHLDFYKGRSLLVKKDLYIFNIGRPVSAYKFAEFIVTKRLVETILDMLPYNDWLEEFSVCNIANKSIFLSGGEK